MGSTTSQTCVGAGITTGPSETRPATARCFQATRFPNRLGCAVARRSPFPPCPRSPAPASAIPSSPSPLRSIPSPCLATDGRPFRPIHGSHSIPSASTHFDTNSQRALARIPPRVSSPLFAPSQKAPTSHGVTRSVQMVGLNAYTQSATSIRWSTFKAAFD